MFFFKGHRMKKTKHFLPATGLSIFFIFALSGCKKYTCECTAYTAGIADSGGKGTFTVKGNAAKRKKNCTDRSTNPDANAHYTQCIIK